MNSKLRPGRLLLPERLLFSWFLVSLLFVNPWSHFFAVSIAVAADPGDFDGDGRLSIRDVLLIGETCFDQVPIAPGALDAFEEFACYEGTPDQNGGSVSHVGSHGIYIPNAVYIESLRRSVSSPLPNYAPQSAQGTWPSARLQAPLQPDSRVRIQLLDATAEAGDGKVELAFELTTDIPLRAFSIVFDSEEGIVRPAYNYLDREATWRVHHWGGLGGLLSSEFSSGELSVQSGLGAYMVTGGSLVVSYGIAPCLFPAARPGEISPGSYVIVVEGRLPVETASGSYALDISPRSEVLSANDELLGFVISDAAARIEVSKDVVEGGAGGVPPIEFDEEQGRILGRTEFRFVGEDGRPLAADEPLFEGFHGENFRAFVQMRTETPLNHIVLGIRWPEDSLRCSFSHLLLVNPDTGLPYNSHRRVGCLNFNGRVFDLEYRLGGVNGSSPAESGENLVDRPLEYFRPLSEWVYVAELGLSIPDSIGSGDLALSFDETPRSAQGSMPVEFAPYTAEYLGGNNACGGEGREPRGFWKYDVAFESAFVRVLGDRPPPPPLELGIEIEVGEVLAMPGDEIEIPVHVSAHESLGVLQFVFETDPAVFEVTSVDVKVLSGATGEFVDYRLAKGESVITTNCDVFPACPGMPYVVNFYDTDSRHAAVQCWAHVDSDLFPDHFPGQQSVELFRLRGRVRSDAPPGRHAISMTSVEIGEAPETELLKTGGRVLSSEGFSRLAPATRIVSGAIIIPQRASPFIRGDSNVDGRVDLSDPIASLSFLFLGHDAPDCLDAADTDDDGQLGLTDAIFQLGTLFLGQGEIPPPSNCGLDPTEDGIDCEKSCTAE